MEKYKSLNKKNLCSNDISRGQNQYVTLLIGEPPTFPYKDVCMLGLIRPILVSLNAIQTMDISRLIYRLNCIRRD